MQTPADGRYIRRSAMIVPIGNRRLATGANARPIQASAKATPGALFHAKARPESQATTTRIPAMAAASAIPPAGRMARYE